MIRATVASALVLTAAFATALIPVRCLGQTATPPAPAPPLPAKATKELPPALLSLIKQKKMPKFSPVLVRIFKEEAELEVWKQDTTGRFQLLKTYPICRWSGDIGPKEREGDRQTPEGFYTITPELMNPNSNYYLAINTGFPNAFDKANGRDGSFLMIHGDCSSSGCYAMTDEQVGEIYWLARDSFTGGRTSFQIQAYPFRMTPANLARHRTSPHMAFWKMIKVGNDHFGRRISGKVDVCNRFSCSMRTGELAVAFVFSPTGPCPPFVNEDCRAALEKQRADEAEFSRLSKRTYRRTCLHRLTRVTRFYRAVSSKVISCVKAGRSWDHTAPHRHAPEHGSGTRLSIDTEKCYSHRRFGVLSGIQTLKGRPSCARCSQAP
jgi:murein L,D-transpeptidase YafK